jgi:hypothetical protein
MRSSQALALEAILEKGLANAKKPGGLLAGLGARLSVASDLPRSGQSRERLATGLDPLDRLLPGGLPRGRLVELSGRRSSGRFSIGLSALASVTSAGEPAALVDLGEHLDPQGAAASGVDLELLLWARPRRVKEALAAAEMLLAAGFPLVVADFGLSACGARFVPDAAWIRLARAVEAQGSSLLLLTPYRMSGIAPDAVLTADASRPLWQSAGRTPRLLTGLSSRLTLQKNARLTPGTARELRLSIQGSFPPLLPGESSSRCHPEERSSFRCHPEERSDEGSAPARARQSSIALTRPVVFHRTPSSVIQNPKSKIQNLSSPPTHNSQLATHNFP